MPATVHSEYASCDVGPCAQQPRAPCAAVGGISAKSGGTRSAERPLLGPPSFTHPREAGARRSLLRSRLLSTPRRFTSRLGLRVDRRVFFLLAKLPLRHGRHSSAFLGHALTRPH